MLAEAERIDDVVRNGKRDLRPVMSKKYNKLIIEGVREDGSKFRPSDWAERLSTTLAQFGADHRLHYAKGVQPIMRNGIKCLTIDIDLEADNPSAYHYIIEFSNSNNLRTHQE